MAIEYTEEQLNTFDKAAIVQLFLTQQSQLKDIDHKLQLVLEQIAVMNHHRCGMSDWQSSHKSDVEFMEKGQYVTPINAVMYAKLKYTPWVDFPPQGSHPLDDWQNIFRSFD